MKDENTQCLSAYFKFSKLLLNFEILIPKMSKTIEETYQKKTPLEHILLRPDTYIGSVEKETQSIYVWDDDTKKIILKNISYVPGLYKIFDEIIVNAADNKIRDPKMSVIKVDIDVKNNKISVFNDGKGVPIEMHKEEKVYVPELIFGQLLTSSNYNDDEKKVTGGRNGYGAKLCNIFSTEFIVETADNRVKKIYKQYYRNNMAITEKPEIESYTDKGFTRITFKPDLKRFKMESLDSDIVSLLKKRVYDLSATVKNIKVYLNGELITVSGFKDYVGLYLPVDAPVVHSIINNRWELAFTVSEDQFQQVSFVNSICTSKGGTHVTHVVDQLIEKIAEQIKKKHKDLTVKPALIKGSIFIFINCLVDNPAFDSQTKENLTLRLSAFGSKCEPIEAFCNKLLKDTNIVDKVSEYAKLKANLQLKKTDGTKTTRLTGIDKLEDANLAGTRRSQECTMILTEGDSAKTLAVSGISQVGRDLYGVFPLRGKVLNVREASNKQILENKEIVALKKILGLQHNKVYENTSSLRYGHLMIMTDQDHDGSHIKGLLINFFDHFYPSLLKIPGFLQEFITPIIRVTKGEQTKDFFTIPEFEEWEKLPEARGWKAKYYKGLGTSNSKDAKQYFSNLPLHVKTFKPLQPEDREAIDLAFNKKKADARKTWLMGFVPGTYLDQTPSHISISDFVNRELILFSMADNIRSIPNVMDGLKPGQRKVMFGCFKKKLYTEIKVAQLVGSISEQTNYRHGETSLATTIIGLAQDFVGANNINLLMPNGQFGSRILGGKDCSSPRYIYTQISAITRTIFHEKDELVLNFLNEEGKSVEPEYYVPVIPMVLVNGAEGIGTGWSTNIPNFNPLDIVENIKRLIRDEPLVEMVPFYRNFKGSIEKIEAGKYQVNGIYEEEGGETVITELPVGVWTQNYKKYLNSLLDDKKIVDFTEHHTEKFVHFRIQPAVDPEILKLNTTISTNNMICFDPTHKIKRYNTVEDILKEFYYIRLRLYMSRKEKLLEIIKDDLLKIENKIRFIQEVVTDSLKINKRKRKDIVEDLEERNYLRLNDFEYLLSMSISSLTYERIDQLNKEYENRKEHHADLLSKTPKDIWLEDLEAFLVEYQKILDEDEEEYGESLLGKPMGKKLKKRSTKKTVADTPKKRTTKKVTEIVEDTPKKRTTKKSTTTSKTSTRKRTKKTVTTEKVETEVKNKETGKIKNVTTTDTIGTSRKIIDLEESSSNDKPRPWKNY
ncbi:DNA topoisomerase 2 [Nosema granulosis]|uniref:DNA topoisomerase 2 n=1 Tax=Nosema granulosis TaxID=83296 RepID=A0A9P6H013_9MICR|nr:DNA topoisomerase 2 [Nosema granulosis]